jgi:putative transposase
LNEEMTEHIGHEKNHAEPGRESTNVRNGTRSKTVVSEGMTTGDISALFNEIYGASVSKETISRITDKVVGEMNDWASRPLDAVYAAVFVTRSWSRSATATH